VDYGNQALKRIPYEEWGLKSIPPLSKRKETEELSGKEKVEVSFPSTLIPQDSVLELLRTLGTERQGLHKSRMIYSFIGMPISAPFALVPIVPNLPFFYLVFRAWSHWRALSGAQHIDFLLDKNLIKPTPSKILDDLYSKGKQPFDAALLNGAEKSSTTSDGIDLEERMVLHKSDGKRIAEALEIPELDVELDRAVWQVEKSLREKHELKQEQRDLKIANSETKEKE